MHSKMNIPKKLKAIYNLEQRKYNIIHPLVQNECCCGICANKRCSNFSYEDYINISV